MSHTPGPWTVIGKQGYAIWCGNEILTSVMRGASFAPSIAHANAVLMAAAPDLLAALEAALTANIAPMPKHYRSVGEEPVWAVNARAAIKKARGQ